MWTITIYPDMSTSRGIPINQAVPLICCFIRSYLHTLVKRGNFWHVSDATMATICRSGCDLTVMECCASICRWCVYIYWYIYMYIYIYTGWWFGTSLFFHILGRHIPIDKYFFRGVETTNQYTYILAHIGPYSDTIS